MQQDLKAEDLIATEQDGSRRINHDLMVEYGLFNLPRPIMRNALMVYYDNARRDNAKAASKVNTFICIANAIAKFPKEVAINFTRGLAYHRNMEFLRHYAK